MEKKRYIVSREDIPSVIKESSEYRFTTKEEENIYCIVSEYGENDYSFWLTEDMENELEGYSSRGSKEEMILEMELSNMLKAVELLKKLNKKSILDIMDAEKNELMVKDIVNLLKEYSICNGTTIYYNTKVLYFREGGKVQVTEDDKWVEEELEWCNPETITMTYEGDDSIYFYVNGYRVEGLEEEATMFNKELLDICDKYKRKYALATDTCLYFIDSDEKDGFKYHYPKKEES